MTRAARYRQFLAVFVVAILATPLIAQSASAPAAAFEMKTIVSGLPSADDSPLVRSAKIAMLARARYAAEGRKSIALDVRTVPGFGSLGSVPDLGPLAPARASVPARGPANLVSGVPATAARPPAAAGVAPGYFTITEVPTTPIAGSVPTSSVGGSVSISSAAGSLRTTSAASSVPMSTPASSVSGTVVP